MDEDYHFDITPHIVKQLGEQLVSDEVTALLELIKNSYDADASYVSIEINTTGTYIKDGLFYEKHKGYIIVEDDGFGMNKETIMKSWLVISYSQKRKFKEEKRKTPKGRTPLGDKGLGRLSTQRLADICEIYTNENPKTGTHIAFNWKDFDKEEILSKVKIQSKNFVPTEKKGTTLVLSNIKNLEVWKGKNLEKFKGQVSQVISPYKENRPFDVFIKINGITVDIEKSNENLRDLAISRFRFSFNGSELSISGKTKLSKFIGQKREEYRNYIEADSGKKFIEFIKKKNKDIKISSENKFVFSFKKKFEFSKDIGGLEIFDGERANPGAFNGVIDEFSLDSWLSDDERLQNLFDNISNYKTFVKSQIGIKIYRNGIAVIPYGLEENNDWLNLKESQTKTSFYDLRPNNVIGYFSIDEGVNSKLKDKTDRSGLDNNAYKRNFFVLAYFIRDEINRYQRKIRKAHNEYLNIYKTENNKIRTTTEAFGTIKKLGTDSKETIAEAKIASGILDSTVKQEEKEIQTVEKNPLFSSDIDKKNLEKSKNLLEKLKTIQVTLLKLEKVVSKTEKLNEVIDVLEPKLQTLEEQLDNFSELAGLGLTVEAVSHEFASIADRLAEKSSFYSSKLENNKLSQNDIYVLMEYIETTVNGLKVQLRHLDPALKYHREKKSVISFSEFFKQESAYYSNRFEKSQISFEIKIDDDFEINANQGKLTQIIDNIFNNSEYWLKQKKENEKSFNPVLTIRVEKPWVYIYDNGYGISKAIENHIFEPFVTTKPKGEGRGLGLFIVVQLIDSLGCSIALEPKINKEGRKYIFAINFSNIIEI
ncbi:ATP-binding protein [Winogradskyella sp. A3E31]|uniref:sensor histidine kinase n=1 Tax=Winogradskyella sp. A3E31 TaxID=3349637 RepID=UPI00398AAA9C